MPRPIKSGRSSTAPGGSPRWWKRTHRRSARGRSEIWSSWSSSRRKRQAGVLRRVERGQHGHGGIIRRRVRFRFAPHDGSSRDPLALGERRSRRFAYRDCGLDSSSRAANAESSRAANAETSNLSREAGGYRWSVARLRAGRSHFVDARFLTLAHRRRLR
jgi:hypothetical protein